MLKNYLKIAVRNLLRQKAYALINLASLTLGLACAVVVLLNAKREYGINHNFAHVERLFRISSQWREKNMGMYLATLAPVGQIMKENLPEVKHFTRLWGGYVVLNVAGQAFRDNMLIADTSYFHMFDFPFAAGDPKTALSAPNNVVITAELAQKCFGREDVVGELITLQLFSGNGKRDFKITGVLKNLPRTSATHFGDSANNIFISSLNLNDFLDPAAFTSWESRYIVTFVELHDAKQADAVQQQLVKLLDQHCPPETRKEVELVLDPMSRLHLIDNESEILKSLRSQYVFALVMLALACINFINLSTARSLRRAKEIGVRKVLGSQRFSLIKQFLFETLLLAALALVLALGLIELFNVTLRPALGNFPAVQIAADLQTLILIIGVALGTGLLAGFYPAFFLSALKPTAVLKSGPASGKSASWFRQALVVVQFSAAIFLIIAGSVVSRQVDFFMSRDLGFKKENLLVIESMPREWNTAGIQKQESFRDRLQKVPGVSSAALCWDVPGGLGSGALELTSRTMTSDQKVVATQLTVDERYLETLGVPLRSGRFFAKEYFHADSANSIVINEAAAKALGLQSPAGETIRNVDGRSYEIIGVVQDFQFSMLERKDKPLALLNVHHAQIYRYMTVRLDTPNLPEAMARLETFWKASYPDVPLIFRFLDALVQQEYTALIRLHQMSRFSTGLALFVACIGLLGLAAYAAERRTKEIGVRKVLGASISNIVGLLSKDFVKLVLFANVLAWPLAYFVMQQWLQDFVNRIELSWWMFALAGGLALLIALLTVSTQALKAALANPVEALRYE